MSVSVAMAEGLLQVLRNRFEGSTLSDLLNSQIYTKYGLQPDALSGSSQSHSSTLDPEEESKSEATFSEEETESPKVKAEPLKAEAEPVKGKTEPPMAQSDSQLFNQLLVTEGMALPPGMKEAASGESGAGRGGQRGGSKSWVPPPREVGRQGRACRGARSLLHEKVHWKRVSIFLPWTSIMYSPCCLSSVSLEKEGPFSRISSSSLPDY